MEQMWGKLNKSNSKNRFDSFNTSIFSNWKSCSSLSYYADNRANTNNSFDTDRSTDDQEVFRLKEILQMKDSELSEKKEQYNTIKTSYE